MTFSASGKSPVVKNVKLQKPKTPIDIATPDDGGERAARSSRRHRGRLDARPEEAGACKRIDELFNIPEVERELWKATQGARANHSRAFAS